jgi:predicted RNase H-like HicB family nuclease
MKLTLLYQEAEEGGYVGQIKEIPEAMSQGETLEELKENIKDSIELVQSYKSVKIPLYTLEEVKTIFENN